VTILIIEDDMRKGEQLLTLVTSLAPTATVKMARSYRSGITAVRDTKPALVLLDMSMPTYDVTDTDDGGRTRGYGGRDILDEIFRHGYETKVLVVTGFDVFGEGRDRKTLEQVDADLRELFSEHYLGSVHYGSADAKWRAVITDVVLSALQENSHD
jgi:CheY-like chemotaxis protein